MIPFLRLSICQTQPIIYINMSKNIDNLPYNNDPDFIGEVELMALDELHDKQFMVAISTGDRDGYKYISSTLRGPYNFFEMIEEVGDMMATTQDHAKTIITSKNRNEPIQYLSSNTVDYIEAHYIDLGAEVLLEDMPEEKEYTCKAEIKEAPLEADPRTMRKDDAK